MYWVNTISRLLNIDTNLASIIYEKMYWFDFSEASETELKNEAKIVLLCMKAR